ncbi:MAG TPA: glycoside hydrolase family 43 protein [Cellvibrionaceae bacterium]|nr:glycoside hydrolase family 43 protein [Cellvibrionaceae bacterium]
MMRYLKLIFMTFPVLALGACTNAIGEGKASSIQPHSFNNPIIKYDTQDPTHKVGEIIYTADPAVMVHNNTVYLYTGHDEQVIGGNDYRMYDYRLWTSDNMINWDNKGSVLRYSDFKWARGDAKTGNAYAGHVVARKNNAGTWRYYFYTTLEGGQTNGQFGFSIGVAVADTPQGPFADPRGMPMILLEETARDQTHSWRNIDPVVFIDDDGRAYLYWGNKQLWWVELEADLIHLKGERYSLNADGKIQHRDLSAVKINTVSGLPNYEEAPYVSKHQGLYYLVYAAGFPESIAYATSTSATGPWQYRGIIMDPLPGTSTIHPAMFDFKGSTYRAYHSADVPSGGSYRRATCIDRVYFNKDGSITKIIPTKKP